MRLFNRFLSKRSSRPAAPSGLRLECLEVREVPAVLLVDDDRVQCPDAQYTSIQAAVDAAHAGDTINVCPGTYAEQVTIPKNKDRLVIQSEVQGAAVITPPAVMADPGALVHVDGAHLVTIDGFTITGPNPQLVAGILVDNNGSATITDNTIRNIQRVANVFGIAESYGIVVGGLVKHDLNGSATIARNTITSYEKTGILVFGPASDVTITDNVVTGAGPIDTIAQNGIQIAYGAGGRVSGNTITGNVYTPAGTEAAGILLGSGDKPSRAGQVTLTGNTVTSNEIGIAAEFQLAPLVISGNTTNNNTQDGIWLHEVKGAEVSNNQSHGNGRSGVYVTETSSNNKILNNDLRGNAGFDAYDGSTGKRTAGTDNTWSGNRSLDDNHGGLLGSP